MHGHAPLCLAAGMAVVWLQVFPQAARSFNMLAWQDTGAAAPSTVTAPNSP